MVLFASYWEMQYCRRSICNENQPNKPWMREIHNRTATAIDTARDLDCDMTAPALVFKMNHYFITKF